LPRVSGKSFDGADTPYVLGNDFPLRTIPSGQEGLTQTMQSHWARFATSGDPNAMGQAGPTWTAYEPDARDEIVLKVPVERGTYAHADECELWKRGAAEELTHAATP
jgi:carboxylesterase type B